MRIFVDADACPVVSIVEKVAKEHSVPVTLLCDTNHVLSSDYSEVIVVGVGADLLLETDGPYVKPERPDDVTGKKWAKARNTSLILPNIAEKIAELKCMMVKDVVRITEENTRRVFKLNNCALHSRYF